MKEGFRRCIAAIDCGADLTVGQIRDFAILGIEESEGDPYENPLNVKFRSSFEDRYRFMDLGYIEGGDKRKGS